MHFLLESFPASSSPIGKPSSLDETLGVESQSRHVETPVLNLGKRHFINHGTTLVSLFSALTLFFILASLCELPRLKNVGPEARGRRLASNRDDDYSLGPPSPELDFLCLAAADWSPADSSSLGPRASPKMVEEVLREAELLPENEPVRALTEGSISMEVLLGAKVAAEGSTAGPGTPSEGDKDTQDAGPSWRFSQPPRVRQETDLPAPFIAPVVPCASLSTKQGHGPLLSMEAQAAHSPAGFPAATVAQPSTPLITPPPTQPGPDGGVVHPFVRLPTLQPGLKIRPWRLSLKGAGPLNKLRQPLLLEIRRLLLQPSLSSEDMERLMANAEALASYAWSRFGSRPRFSSKPVDVVREQGLKFMVFSALHSVTQLAGPLPSWWPEIAKASLTNIDAPLEAPTRRTSSPANRELAEGLRLALLQYRSGNAPPPKEVIRLKRLLLCSQWALTFFRGPEWEPWRDDNMRALKGLL